MLWNYARLTGLLLSIEPLADVIGIDACYDGEYEIEYNAQSTHPLSDNARLNTGTFYYSTNRPACQPECDKITKAEV